MEGKIPRKVCYPRLRYTNQTHSGSGAGTKYTAAMRGIGANVVLHSSYTINHVICSRVPKTMSVQDNPGLTSVTWESHRENQSPPDLRFLHFNDVYHVEYAAPK